MSVSVSKISKLTRRKSSARGKLPVKRRSAIQKLKPNGNVPAVAPDLAIKENLSSVVKEIRDKHRMRQDLMRAEISLTLQIKSVERRYCQSAILGQLRKKPMPLKSLKPSGFDLKTVKAVLSEMKKRKLAIFDGKTIALPEDLSVRKFKSDVRGLVEKDIASVSVKPLVNARDQIRPATKKAQRVLAEAVEGLQIFEQFTKPLNGMGAMGLAQIIAEVGDFRNYDTISRVWKRMGLAVIDGKAQRRVKGADALVHGYSPIRRSIMWNIGESLIKKKNAYRTLYLECKAEEKKEAEKRGLTVVPAAKITKKNADKHMSMKHVHNRARRYVEKRLLLDLWKKWREIYMPKETA